MEARKLADLYRAQFRARSPRKLLEWLKFLEPLLTGALERLKFQPGGEAHKKEIDQDFADAMVVAWMSATGKVPPIWKGKKPGPFQQLLKTINCKILRPEAKHETDFQSAAVYAVDRARKKGRTPRP